MSQPVSRVLHPFDAARHPSMEPEVERFILTSWTSERSGARNKPAPQIPFSHPEKAGLSRRLGG